jgi:outer membrane receptor protein involved in Fe transport
MKSEFRGKLCRATMFALAGAAAVSATGMTSVAYAQTGVALDQLQEVIVTAERREQDVQKIAASVSVRTGEDLQAEGKYTLAQILQDIPGVQGGAAPDPGTGGGSGTDSAASGVVIRGIRSNLGTGGSITSVASSAATYVDDVYQGIGGNYDISRVEVLRGPQGTLYGRSAVSGAVGTYTRNPELGKFGGFGTVEFGGNDIGAQNIEHYTAGVNIPLTDQFAVRVAANRYSAGGMWRDQAASATGGNGGKNDQNAAKIKILYKPSENLSILVGGAFENNRAWSGSTGVTITQPVIDQVVVTDSPIVAFTPGTNKYRQIWARLDWNLGFGTLTYIPAVRKFENELLVNNTTSTNCQTLTTLQMRPASIGGITPNGVQCFTQPTATPFDQFTTHEFRIASNPGSKLTWQAGAMYYLNKLDNHTDNEYVNPRDGLNTYVDSCLYPPFNYVAGVCVNGGNTKYLLYSDTHKKTQAVGLFAEATYPVTDSFRFTGGLRYDDTKVTDQQFYYAHRQASCLGSADLYVNLGATGVTGCNVLADDGVRKFKNTTWKARGEYDVAAGHLVYASVSTGASPGDLAVTTGADGKPSILVLKAQTLTSYSVGSKNRFLDNKLQANGEVYYQDYGGYQEANVNIGTTEPVFTSIITPVKFYGFDAELLYQLTPKDRAGLNVGYTHGSYVGQSNVLYNSPATPFAAAAAVTLGDYIAFKTVYGIVPVTVNGNYDHTFTMQGGSKLNWHGDVKYTSSYYPSRLSKANVAQGLPPYTFVSSAYVFNTNLMWTSPAGKYSVNGYIRNLFNKRYKTGGGCGFGGDCSVVTNRTANISDMRTFGVIANVSF